MAAAAGRVAAAAGRVAAAAGRVAAAAGRVAAADAAPVLSTQAPAATRAAAVARAGIPTMPGGLECPLRALFPRGGCARALVTIPDTVILLPPMTSSRNMRSQIVRQTLEYLSGESPG